MRQVVHLIKKQDIEKEYVKLLKLELDYELATLYDAVQAQDEQQIQQSKKRLFEIHQELENYNAFA